MEYEHPILQMRKLRIREVKEMSRQALWHKPGISATMEAEGEGWQLLSLLVE